MLSAALVVFALTGPPVDLGADYQLGGAYRPAEGVGVVARDRRAQPASGPTPSATSTLFRHSLVRRWWLSRHPDLVLRSAGKANRGQELGRVAAGHRHEDETKGAGPHRRPLDRQGAASSGFDAVEPDNLDSWQRSKDYFDVVTTWLSRSFS